MPTEYKRKMHMLRVKLPDDRTVDTPLIDEIWFKDEQDNSQRYHFIFRNRKAADGDDVPAIKRKVHTASIISSGDPGTILDCERIETFEAKFPQQKSQKKTYVIRKGNAPQIPQHLKTHVYKVKNSGDESPDAPWIKMQRIDKLKVRDAQDGGQEKTFVLNWAKYENAGDLSSVATVAALDAGSSPPWRFDPFQNPVDLSSSTPIAPLYIAVGARAYLHVLIAPREECGDPDPGCGDLPTTYSAGYASGVVWNSTSPVVWDKTPKPIHFYQQYGLFSQAVGSPIWVDIPGLPDDYDQDQVSKDFTEWTTTGDTADGRETNTGPRNGSTIKIPTADDDEAEFNDDPGGYKFTLAETTASMGLVCNPFLDGPCCFLSGPPNYLSAPIDFDHTMTLVADREFTVSSTLYGKAWIPVGLYISKLRQKDTSAPFNDIWVLLGPHP